MTAVTTDQQHCDSNGNQTNSLPMDHVMKEEPTVFSPQLFLFNIYFYLFYFCPIFFSQLG